MTPALAVLLPGFTGPTLPGWLDAKLRAGLAGVCLFATNIESREQLRELTDAIRRANPFALIAIDEEGGDVTRLYSDQGSPYPGNALLGRIDDEDLTAEVATDVGWELRRAGVNLDFAPDVDINSNSENPVIGVRSFGADADLVARHSAAWVRALQSTGVAACVKHFPGHGDTSQDSHVALPTVDVDLETLEARELLPFAATITAGSRAVMTSHILLPRVDPDNPATFSSTILQGLLRETLGFGGVIVTDALDMVGASGEIGIPAAAVRSLAAGADLLCIGTDNSDDELDAISDAIALALERGELEHARLAAAAARTLALGREYAATAVVGDPGRRDWPLEPVIGAFDVQPGVGTAEQPVPRDAVFLTIETAPNIAVGRSPWGVAAAGASTIRLHEGDPLPEKLDDVVIVGKDNHRTTWVREVIDRARERHPSVLVVDMGWPSNDRRYADIATFGASRCVGVALLSWLSDAAPPVSATTARKVEPS